MEDNLTLYNSFRQVPDNAKKTITGGRLNGFTDINPMWRIKVLTERFGPAGIGWYIEEVEHWEREQPNTKETAVFVKIHLYVRYKDEWSKPILGIGGSSLIAKEKNGLFLSDEAYKMAYTDAISVACKALGIGADVYFNKDVSSKYQDTPKTTTQTIEKKSLTPEMKTTWTSAINYIKSGHSIQDVKKKYTLTKENEEKLIKESNG